MRGILAAYRRNAHPDKTVFHLNKMRFSPVFGRENELEQLRNAWASHSIALFSLQGDSGMGKTTLIRLWLQQLASKYWADIDALFVWCFPHTDTPAAQRAAIDDFFKHALLWLLDKGESLPPSYEHPRQIIERLSQQRALLVLDNIPCLEANGKTELDVALQAFLEQLAAVQQGMCLLAGCTSMPESVLALPNSEHLSLQALQPDAAVQLLWRLGVKGDMESLQRLVRQFGEYPLTLALTAQYLLHWHDGDVHRADSIPIWYDPKDKGRAIRRVLAAYEVWLGNTPELAMLYFMPLFRRPFRIQDLQSWVAVVRLPWLSRWRTEAGSYESLVKTLQMLSNEGWEQAWQRLLQFGLLEPYVDGQYFEMQSVVGEYFTRQLQTHYPAVWEHEHSASVQTGIHDEFQGAVPTGEQLAVVLMRRAQYQDWLGASEISSLVGESRKGCQKMQEAETHAKQAVMYADLGMDLQHLQDKLLALSDLLDHSGEQSDAQNLNEQADCLQA